MLLLDTCTFFWLTSSPTDLSIGARDAIRLHAAALHVSAISAFEIALKSGAGKLRLPLPLDQWFASALRLHGVRELPVTSGIAILATQVSPLHRDPFDRMIVATAVVHRLEVVTPDQLIRQYPEVRSIW